eukprot:gene57718-biopygen74271
MVALRNDGIVGDTPSVIYRKKVTIAELLAASPYRVGLRHFEIEFHGDERNVLVHQAKRREGFTGSAAVFPLPLEALFENLGGEEWATPLPRSATDIAQSLQVTFRGHADDVEAVRDIAYVRRDVVMELIEEMVKRRHPAYRHLTSASAWEEAKERASRLPEDGIPYGVITMEYISSDDSDDVDAKKGKKKRNGKKKQSNPLAVAKAAVPPEPPDSIGSRVFVPRPIGLVEGEAATDSGIRDARSVEQLQQSLEQQSGKLEVDQSQTKITLTNGSEMLDQFVPWFATIAFPFLLPLGAGGADFYGKERRRKGKRVELGEWYEHCLRRIELQFRRDNVFAFTIFNIAFRSLISKGTYPLINSRMAQGLETIRAQHWANIARVLRDGFVKQPGGGTRKVAGRLDLAVRAEGLDATTKSLLAAVDTACASIPGTRRVRRTMGRELFGYNVFFGLPLFFTVSPNDRGRRSR